MLKFRPKFSVFVAKTPVENAPKIPVFRWLNSKVNDGLGVNTNMSLLLGS